ncbi:unnamed protein product [Haemonchus placei]|uniref:Uncharacterized protein n=1 Tax=Haemonchus placei TaxID=6290 RepID=A0A0N4WFH1_HAEPC|nr:unnamed protein product [Haemonchus placei]
MARGRSIGLRTQRGLYKSATTTAHRRPANEDRVVTGWKSKKKVANHVSLRFPLPPPTGEYDDMDETQYDVRVPALRDTKSKESKEEGIGSTDIEADSREEQVPTIATMMREERREEPKLSDRNGKKKEPQFLFEAPPPYDQNILMPPGRRRMVAIELADLPVRKVGDTRVLEANSSNQSSSTGTAISEPANNSKPGLQAGSSEMTGPIRVSLPPTPPSMDMECVDHSCATTAALVDVLRAWSQLHEKFGY